MGKTKGNPEISKRIEGLFSQKVSSVKDALEKIGMPEPSYYRALLNGIWKSEHLFNIARYFKVSLDWLAYGEILQTERPDKPLRKIPELGYATCGNAPATWFDDAKTFLEIADTEHLSNPFVLTARGDSMKPYIEAGDKLLCADMPDRINDGSAVVVGFKSLPDTYEVNAKLISLDKKNSMVTLYSINTKFKPVNYREDDIAKIYKLVKIIRDVK